MLYPSCPKCEGMMTEGYLLEQADSGVNAAVKFADGAPRKSVWLGLKVKPEETFLVTVFRCIDCGYLESYARPQPKKA